MKQQYSSAINYKEDLRFIFLRGSKLRPLQNLHPLNFRPYTLRRMNIFDQKMPLEVTF